MSALQPATVHDTAVLEGEIILGNGVHIGSFCHIVGPVIIGDMTTVGSHSVVSGPIEIGCRNTVQSHCVLGSHPESRGASVNGNITIGNDNIFCDRSVVTHGTLTLGTSVGDRNYFLTGTHVSHDCRIADDVTMAHNTVLGGHVTVHKGATFGIGTTVHQHSTIGAYSMLGMGAVVTRDVPPFALVAGNPASFRRWNTHQFSKFNMESDPSGDDYDGFVALFNQDSHRKQLVPRREKP